MGVDCWEHFDSFVKAVMAAENIARCAVGVSRGGRPLHVAGYGLRDNGPAWAMFRGLRMLRRMHG